MAHLKASGEIIVHEAEKKVKEKKKLEQSLRHSDLIPPANPPISC